jgi:phosphoglycerol transferase
MRFPEGGPVGEVTEYEMLRPYFFTRTLRFSFGSMQGRPRELWQFETERMPPGDALRRLESLGFGALYLDRRGVPDRGESWLTAAKNLGRTEQFQDGSGNLVCVRLQPAATPQWPPNDDALVRIHRGLAMEERSPQGVRHWMSGNATFSFFSEERAPRMFTLTATVASLTARKVTIEYQGRVVWSAELQAGMAAPVKLEVEGRPGYNKFYVRTDAPPESPQPDAVRIAYALIQPRVTKAR